jgi:hypothetical protein
MSSRIITISDSNVSLHTSLIIGILPLCILKLQEEFDFDHPGHYE